MTAQIDKQPGLDGQLDIVSDQTRRQLLLALADDVTQRETPLDLSDWLAETDCPATPITLQHVHLPKLEDHGLIQRHQDDIVTRGPKFSEIEPLLTVLRDNRAKLPAERV